MKNNILLLSILLIIIFLGSFCFLKTETFSKDDVFSFIDESAKIFKPYLIKTTAPDIQANIASSVLLNEDKKIILYEKNIEEKTAIASLTKLMTAVVVMDNYPLDSKIIVDEEMLTAWGTAGGLILNEHVTIEDLLYILLIESSNDAAECLASKLNRNNFIILMNEKAKKLKMRSTHFVNPSGLDEDDGTYNTSSAKDLTVLVSEIIKNYPTIKDILSKTEYTIISEEGIRHKLSNTNALLKEIPYETWGKTGYTEIANGCLILMTKNSNNDTIINIIINSNDRFGEMKTLTNWTVTSFSY